ALDEWKAFPGLSDFQEKANQGQVAFLSREHMRLSSELKRTVSDMMRGLLTGANAHTYYEKKAKELLVYVARDTVISGSTLRKSPSRPEAEKLHEVRAYILENLDKNYRLADLAYMAGMNQSKLE